MHHAHLQQLLIMEVLQRAQLQVQVQHPAQAQHQVQVQHPAQVQHLVQVQHLALALLVQPMVLLQCI